MLLVCHTTYTKVAHSDVLYAIAVITVRLNIHSGYLDNISSLARTLDSVYNSSFMDTSNLGIPPWQTVESVNTSRLHTAVRV